MPRWKKNNDGTAYYDPNDDSNQNQIEPPPGTATPTAPSAPAPPAIADPNRRVDLQPSPQFNWAGAQTPGESREQTFQRYQNDYHSANRDSVLSQMRGEVSGQPTTPAAPVAPATPPQYQYMEGVDTRKLNDPSHTTPKYVASRILASGGSIQDAAAAIGATVLGPDKMRLSDGTEIDTRRDIEGANALQWTVTHDPFAAPQGAGAGVGGFQSQLAGGPSGVAGTAGIPGGAVGDLYNTLLQRSQQGLDINSRSPIIANQVDSYRAEQERANRNNLDQQAEAGGPNANLNSERRLGSERAAQATGNLQSTLMGNELTARRNEIQNALTQMGSLLSDQQRMALQQQLAMMDNSLRQQQMQQTHSEFLDQLGLNAEDRASYWDAVRQGIL